MLTIKGKIAGVKENKRPDKNTGELKISYKVGFAVERANGYAGQTDIMEVSITQSQKEKGLQAYYEKLVGKEVSAPVFCMAWSNGKNVSYYFEGDGKAVA